MAWIEEKKKTINFLYLLSSYTGNDKDLQKNKKLIHNQLY